MLFEEEAGLILGSGINGWLEVDCEMDDPLGKAMDDQFDAIDGAGFGRSIGQVGLKKGRTGEVFQI